MFHFEPDDFFDDSEGDPLVHTIYTYLRWHEAEEDLVDRLVAFETAERQRTRPVSPTVIVHASRASRLRYERWEREDLIGAVLDNVLHVGAAREPVNGFLSDPEGQFVIWLPYETCNHEYPEGYPGEGDET